MQSKFSFKEKLGAGLYDLPRFLWVTRPESTQLGNTASWVFFRNRNERLIPARVGLGVQCDWQWTSDLYLTKVFPRLGRRLMRRALRDWPIVLDASASTEAPQRPQVSFIIGHRGPSRVAHLLATLQSIAAQRRVALECIVVEQSNEPEVEYFLPPWVRYIHTPLPRADVPYSRSWAFNVGADLARGDLLILHDNDMLLPQDYAAQIIARQSEGYDVINPKRFIFYLGKDHSERIMTSKGILLDTSPDSVVQNLEAGGSVAITRKAFFAIGGFDETFIGWGGEDNEFWERAQTRRVWTYGYMPIVHLWHENQPDKERGEDAPAKRKYWELATIPPDQRIRNLLQRQAAQTSWLQS